MPEIPHPSRSLLDELVLLEGGAPLVSSAPSAPPGLPAPRTPQKPHRDRLEVVTTPTRTPFTVRACARLRGVSSAAGAALVVTGVALHLLPLPWPVLAGDAATAAGLAGVALVALAALLSVAAPRGRWSSVQVLASPLSGRCVEVDESGSTGAGSYGRAHAVGLVLDVAVPDPAAVPVPGRRAALARRVGLLPVGDAATFGEPVLAPADATVLRVVDGSRDHACRQGHLARFAGGLLDAVRELVGARAVFGNHVVLDCGAGRYAVMPHLRRGSVRVSRGDRVLPGQVVGAAGCSGAVAEPQVQLVLVDTPRLRLAAGVPVRLVSVD
ncbi:Peptidase family M23 [Quadrisphaera granulorum]|uniref:Peptidase M23-like protein n=1 Tax=Quadrisphaera granulorum TaxID=317664 RepID=A0A316ADW5_9ACTN|nr:peptidase M23-like protein [Quadrisphaera granulorum]SZE95308.1 Peptidase family M23 [Quadrisphaera granulorum]